MYLMLCVCRYLIRFVTTPKCRLIFHPPVVASSPGVPTGDPAPGVALAPAVARPRRHRWPTRAITGINRVRLRPWTPARWWWPVGERSRRRSGRLGPQRPGCRSHPGHRRIVGGGHRGSRHRRRWVPHRVAHRPRVPQRRVLRHPRLRGGRPLLPATVLRPAPGLPPPSRCAVRPPARRGTGRRRLPLRRGDGGVPRARRSRLPTVAGPVGGPCPGHRRCGGRPPPIVPPPSGEPGPLRASRPASHRSPDPALRDRRGPGPPGRRRGPLDDPVVGAAHQRLRADPGADRSRDGVAGGRGGQLRQSPRRWWPSWSDGAARWPPDSG